MLDQIKPFADYFRQMMADEISMSVKYLSEKEEHVWWYDGEYIVVSNENTLAILKHLMTHPKTTVRGLTEVIGINKSAIQRQLKQMSEKGWIIPPQSQGHASQWHVVIKPSMP
jgi:predicted transcriptional regulator